MKMRCFRSTGVKLLVWLTNISALPRTKAAFIERKVKASQDFGLGFGIDTSGRCGTLVNPGDGRISNEVMTTKDHRAAQVLAKGIVAVRAFKVTL